ncbi:MAG TPA: YncE family protein [Gaiellaceae bacterium]|nr:YncE family protein [Gaiellaceae bacterium]
MHGGRGLVSLLGLLALVWASTAGAAAPRTIDVGATPMSLAYGAGSVWAANKDGGTVSRIDPRTDRVVATVRVGGQPWGLAFDGRSLWVGNYAAGTISRIDPRTNRVAARVRVGTAPIALAYGRGALWVADYSTPALFRVGPRAGKVAARYPIPGAHLDVLPRPSGIWLASESGELTVFDPGRRRVTHRLTGGADTTFVEACGAALWATNFEGTVVWRVDERRAAVTKRVRVGRRAAGIACARGSVWVASYETNRLLRITSGGRVAARLQTGPSPTDVLAAAGSVWVANSASGSVTRFPLP